MLEGMWTLRSLPVALTLLLVACGGGTFPGSGVDQNRTAVTISPSKATLHSRGVLQFTATVRGNRDRVISWSTTAGTVSSSGFYKAPTVTAVTTALITARTATGSTTTTITIQPPMPPMPPGSSAISVSVSPATVTLKSGTGQQFTAAVSGTMNHDVTWSVTNGTVTSGGQFLAPGVGVITHVSVKATSRDDPTKSASADVTVIAQAEQHSVDLNWNASTSANIVGYNVYRGQASSGPYSKINAGGPVASTLYSDTSVANGMTYFYAATVVDSSGRESAHSNQVQAAIPR
jgi:hypothetical protein